LESINEKTLLNALTQVYSRQKQAYDQYKKDSLELQRVLEQNDILRSEVINLRKEQRSGHKRMDILLSKLNMLCQSTDNTKRFLDSCQFVSPRISPNAMHAFGVHTENFDMYSRRNSGRESYRTDRSDVSSTRGLSKERSEKSRRGSKERDFQFGELKNGGSPVSEVTTSPSKPTSQDFDPETLPTSSSDETSGEDIPDRFAIRSSLSLKSRDHNQQIFGTILCRDIRMLRQAPRIKNQDSVTELELG